MQAAREAGEAVARTDAEARAVIKSLEETAAPAASGVVDKPMWHGSSQRFDTFGAGHGDERALFGLGVYTTDDMSVAVGYSQKRPIGAATQIREGYVYNVVWRGGNPPRVLDLEATMPDEVRGIARSIVDSLDDSVLTAEVPLDDWEELVSIVGDPASTFEDFYRKLVRVFTESGQPSTEFIDTLQEMSDDLVEAGVDAFRYTGGKRVGQGHLHEAMVWLDSESVEVVQAGNIEGLLRGSAGGVARETGEAAARTDAGPWTQKLLDVDAQRQAGIDAGRPRSIQALSETIDVTGTQPHGEIIIHYNHPRYSAHGERTATITWGLKMDPTQPSSLRLDFVQSMPLERRVRWSMPVLRKVKQVIDEMTAEGITIVAEVALDRPDLLRSYERAGFVRVPQELMSHQGGREGMVEMVRRPVTAG